MKQSKRLLSILLAILMLTLSMPVAFAADALYPQEMNFSNGADVIVIGANGVLNNYWLSGKINGYTLSGILDQNGDAWTVAPSVQTDDDRAEVYRVDTSSSLPGAFIARAFFSKPHDAKDYTVNLIATINSEHPAHAVTTATKAVTVYVPHTITIDPDGGDYDGETELTLYTAGAESAHYKATSAALTAPTKEGLKFAGWELEGEGTLSDDGTVFTAGNGDATLTAQWESNHVHDYSVFIRFDWSEDYSSASAILKCSADEATIAEPLDVEVEETEGDCETATEILYSVQYSSDDDDYYETKQVFIPPTGHDYQFEQAEWADDYSGVTLTFRCSVCKNTMEQFLSADISETDPDCETDGSIVYTVQYSEDNFDFEDSKKVTIPATGHSFTNYTFNNDATHGKNGTETAICDHGCGKKDTREAAGTEIAHDFQFDHFEWSEDYSEAKAVLICPGDGVTETEDVEVSVEENEATCTEDTVIIYTAVYSCDDDDFEESKKVVLEGTALTHSFTNYVYNNDAKCGVDGTETAVCDHSCGETDTRIAEDTALTHSFTNYVYNNDAKCGVDGTETAVCDHGCGETNTRTAEGTALTHIFSNYVYNKDAKCGVDGTETALCDHGCGETDTRTAEGTALTHSFTNYVYNKDAKCGVNGTETAVCDHGCGETDTRTAEGTALEHRDGNNDGRCDMCGQQMKGNGVCKYCGKHHTGFFGFFIRIFHNIAYFFRTLFRR
ncbi:MAG: InlB B-repeat-containing protein [Clostridia bacterium]|nr:InlB B-repeat-containing protein [Clostridia bacterium]